MRPGAVCVGGCPLRRRQSLSLFARGPSDERERPRTGAAPARSGVGAQAPAGAPRPTQPRGGGRAGRGSRRCRAFGAAGARPPSGDDLRHGGGRAGGLRPSGSRQSASARCLAQSAAGALLARGAPPGGGGGGLAGRSTKHCTSCPATPGPRCPSVRRNSWRFARPRTSTPSTRRAVRRRARRRPRSRWWCSPSTARAWCCIARTCARRRARRPRGGGGKANRSPRSIASGRARRSTPSAWRRWPPSTRSRRSCAARRISSRA